MVFLYTKTKTITVKQALQIYELKRKKIKFIQTRLGEHNNYINKHTSLFAIENLSQEFKLFSYITFGKLKVIFRINFIRNGLVQLLLVSNVC